MIRALTVSVALLLTLPAMAQEIKLGEKGILKVGNRIWQNEGEGTINGLTAWNKGEDFASLGIGHFIWYPAGKRGPFEESFPGLVKFLRDNGAIVPTWLKPKTDCPWNTRAEFMADFESERMKELRWMLKNTVVLQTQYIVKRLEASLPKMLAAADSKDRNRVQNHFFAVASTPAGVYALIDYVNFKGEGTSPTERYNGKGWGLLQVLEGMKGTDVPAFEESAKHVLTRRVKNSPPARNEAQWLEGWKNRIDGYSSF